MTADFYFNRLNQLDREQQERFQKLADLIANSNTKDLVILHLFECFRGFSAQIQAMNVQLQANNAKLYAMDAQLQANAADIRMLQQTMAQLRGKHVDSNNFSTNNNCSLNTSLQSRTVTGICPSFEWTFRCIARYEQIQMSNLSCLAAFNSIINSNQFSDICFFSITFL